MSPPSFNNMYHDRPKMVPCLRCGASLPLDVDGPGYCKKCRVILAKYDAPRAPFLKGLSDGPGSGPREMVFDRPNVPKEMEITFKQMEDDGKFRGNPELLRNAQYCLRKAKDEAARNPSTVDYSNSRDLNG